MRRVLVVDDEPAAVKGLRMLLELEGYDVVGTESPQRALELLAQEPFDALVTDLEMPAVGGIALVRAALAAQPRIVALVVTGYAESPAAVASMAVGAAGVLGKPLDVDALVTRLQAAFPAG